MESWSHQSRAPGKRCTKRSRLRRRWRLPARKLKSGRSEKQLACLCVPCCLATGNCTSCQRLRSGQELAVSSDHSSTLQFIDKSYEATGRFFFVCSSTCGSANPKRITTS